MSNSTSNLKTLIYKNFKIWCEEKAYIMENVPAILITKMIPSGKTNILVTVSCCHKFNNDFYLTEAYVTFSPTKKIQLRFSDSICDKVPSIPSDYYTI